MTPEEHLRFLTRHTLKHFAHEWTAFRVFYDTVLYMVRYREWIDMNHIWKELKQLGAETLFQTFLSILVRNGCFREIDFPDLCLQPEKNASCFLRIFNPMTGKYRTVVGKTSRRGWIMCR